MSKQSGSMDMNGRRLTAERWCNGRVFVLIGASWYEPIGQESKFTPA